MEQNLDTRMTITIPASLRKLIKVNAAKNDRTLSREIVHCLKAGSGWFEATGYEKEKGEAPA